MLHPHNPKKSSHEWTIKPKVKERFPLFNQKKKKGEQEVNKKEKKEKEKEKGENLEPTLRSR